MVRYQELTLHQRFVCQDGVVVSKIVRSSCSCFPMASVFLQPVNQIRKSVVIFIFKGSGSVIRKFVNLIENPPSNLIQILPFRNDVVELSITLIFLFDRFPFVNVTQQSAFRFTPSYVT